MTDETKSIFASKTVWGAGVAILASLAGVPLTTDDQGTLVELVTQGATLLGAGVALWGRLTATRRIRT
jgi:hypothetical protein